MATDDRVFQRTAARSDVGRISRISSRFLRTTIQHRAYFGKFAGEANDGNVDIDGQLDLVGIAFLALLLVGIIFSRLYRRSSKERSFVRTGLGGQKVVNGWWCAQISLQEQLALIQALPKIIEEAVKPMQNIDSIRIMQVDGLNTGAANGATDGMLNGTSANLAEQAVGAASKYRAYAPVLDQLIKEVGLSGEGLNGLVKVTSPTTAAVSMPAVPAQA